MKSRNRKRSRSPGLGRGAETGSAVTPVSSAPGSAAAQAAAADVAPTVAQDWPDRLFIPAAVVILLVAAALRLPELGLNPFHHDEGVNGFFTTNLVRNGTYTYDPANYHGPSLYYFAFISEILFGLTTEAMRLVPALFGILTVGLV